MHWAAHSGNVSLLRYLLDQDSPEEEVEEEAEAEITEGEFNIEKNLKTHEVYINII